MVRRIPHQLGVAFVRELVAGDCGSDDLTAMAGKGITAEAVAPQEAAGVCIPAGIITGCSCARTFGLMHGAESSVCDLAATRRSAEMFRLEHLIAALPSLHVCPKHLL